MDNLGTALEALAASTGVERLPKRLEAAIDEPTDMVLRELARELAGTGDAKMYRSRAARMLLREGAIALRAKRNRKK